MLKVGAAFQKNYFLKPSEDPMFFPKRGADIMFNSKSIGSIGVLHPEVLGNFNLKYPVTCFEVDVEDIFEHFRNA